ncbi:transcriptional regulator [Microvirga roseola]|uniref:transcriptional regulator n=1 Tax=Microvirga roseola TaxID=2883126 RepID=UPI001E62847A|nr:transcriptional regulator [Microvirga roseola]
MADSTRLEELVRIRTALGFSQAEMAYKLELTVREYQALEWGESEIPNVYWWAVERLALAQAAQERSPRMVPAAVLRDVHAIMPLARGIPG